MGAAVLTRRADLLRCLRPSPKPAVLLPALLLGVGVVLTGLGFGLGVPRATRPGVGVGSVLGVAALVLGVVLVTLGTVGLVRATPGWWRLATVPVLLLAVVVGVYVLAVPLAAALPAREPADADPSSGVEEVTVPTADAERLAGWFAPTPGSAAVVLLPGSGSSRDAVVDHMTVLHEGGYAVLALDPRGHGRSTGRGMDWGWYGETDVADAVSYLRTREDVDADRIAVVGTPPQTSRAPPPATSRCGRSRAPGTSRACAPPRRRGRAPCSASSTTPPTDRKEVSDDSHLEGHGGPRETTSARTST